MTLAHISEEVKIRTILKNNVSQRLTLVAFRYFSHDLIIFRLVKNFILFGNLLFKDVIAGDDFF